MFRVPDWHERIVVLDGRCGKNCCCFTHLARGNRSGFGWGSVQGHCEVVGVVVSGLVVWSVCAAWWRGARAGVGVAGEARDVEGEVAQDGEDVWAGAGAGPAGGLHPGVRSRIPVRPVLDEWTVPGWVDTGVAWSDGRVGCCGDSQKVHG